MDVSNPWSLISGIMLGVLGMGLFIYGKKSQQFAPIFAGAALCAIPYFVASAALAWLLAAVCIAGLYVHARTA